MIKLSGKVYDALKFGCTILIPALTTFYCNVGRALGWKYIEEVALVSSEFCLLIGSIIGLSSLNYWKVHEVTPIAQEDENTEI